MKVRKHLAPQITSCLQRFADSPAGFARIDRCGKHFATILTWLRDGDVPLPTCPTEVEELCQEAKYYLCEVNI